MHCATFHLAHNSSTPTRCKRRIITPALSPARIPCVMVLSFLKERCSQATFFPSSKSVASCVIQLQFLIANSVVHLGPIRRHQQYPQLSRTESAPCRQRSLCPCITFAAVVTRHHNAFDAETQKSCVHPRCSTSSQVDSKSPTLARYEEHVPL